MLLSCPTEGKPEPEIRWRKEGKLLLAGNITQTLAGGKIAVDGAELRVDAATNEAAGRYSCEAKNRAGVSEQDFFVDVQSKSNYVWHFGTFFSSTPNST